MAQPSKQLIRPYGDRRDDGVVQLSFTLPVPLSEKAKEAAAPVRQEDGLHRREGGRRRARRGPLHLLRRLRAHAASRIDYAEIDVPEVVIKKLGFDELNALIEEKVGRRVVVFGACTGTDTHTVGIDAILNMKGYAGDYGLERYPWFEAYNLGSQVPNEELIRQAKAKNADAILVSQVVTQRDVHKDNSRAVHRGGEGGGAPGQDDRSCSAGRASTTSSRSSSASTRASARAPSRRTWPTSSCTQVLQKLGKESASAHCEGEPK